MTYIRFIRKAMSLLGMFILLAIGTVSFAAEDEVQGPILQETKPGTLLLPAGVETKNVTDKAEKRCMTVCSRWGEECTFINRGIGGMSRKCRRACKQFSEECF